MIKNATISECGQYRYMLSRVWDEKLPEVIFIGVNPSTADATEDDPTIRRCISFARSWGYGGLVMLNLFAYRSTDPDNLELQADPIGPDNNNILMTSVICSKGLVICAWGVNGGKQNRDYEVLRLLRVRGKKLHSLGVTKKGYPRHPLYIKADKQPQLFRR